MKKSNRKLEFTAAIMFLVIAGVFVYLFEFSEGMCSNEIYREVPSPDKSLKAVIFTRNCGATTNYGTHVTILDNDEELDNLAGDIFGVDGHATESAPLIKWVNNSHLNIRRRPNKREYLAANQWGWFKTVKISYNPSN